jgi:hypothetical protein
MEPDYEASVRIAKKLARVETACFYQVIDRHPGQPCHLNLLHALTGRVVRVSGLGWVGLEIYPTRLNCTKNLKYYGNSMGASFHKSLYLISVILGSFYNITD